MKKIGMIVAVEMDAVLSLYGQPCENIELPGYTVMVYQAESYTLYVLNSGAGEIAASAAAQLLISLFQVELIVNFGVVGGLTADMALARTCVVESVVHYDFDTSEAMWAEPARYLQYDSIYIKTDRALVQRAIELHPELMPVVCASADKFVGDPEKKRALHEKYGAHICEMEAAGILITCDRNKLPCLMIKTVSDGIEGGAEEFKAELLRSSSICLEIADRIIKEL